MVCSHCPIQIPIKMGCFQLCGDVPTAQRWDQHRFPLDSLWIYQSLCLPRSCGVRQCKHTIISQKFVQLRQDFLSSNPVQLCKAASNRTKREFVQTVAHWSHCRGQHCTMLCTGDCIPGNFSFRNVSLLRLCKSFNGILLLNLIPNTLMLTLFKS